MMAEHMTIQKKDDIRREMHRNDTSMEANAAHVNSTNDETLTPGEQQRPEKGSNSKHVV